LEFFIRRFWPRGVARVIIRKKTLASLAPADYNPRSISSESLAGLTASVERFGNVQPIVWNKRTGNVVSGHQRLRVLLARGDTETRVVVVDLDEIKEKALNITCNNPHIAGDFTASLQPLLVELKEFDPSGLLRLDALVQPAPRSAPPPADPPENPVTKPGDLWLMGAHRLLCGDSLRAPVPEDIGCYIFDPPWDKEIPAREVHATNVLAFCDGFRLGDVVSAFGSPAWCFTWDCVTSWYTPGRPLRRGKYCLLYGPLNYDFNGSHYGEPGEAKVATNSRGSYQYTPDPRGKHLSDIFQFPITQRATAHSHAKPLDWIRMLIGNCTDGLIFDPFAGSGTSLIAAEQLERKCVAHEIDPGYCDVIVQRWETLTDQKAVLDGS
ncbi:MAG: ParB N-terminal domain-containing protein, partial [Candidatus Eisenbacteria sp.]|nr:ParB N-terminal domain-containing protein [Candidatus Eisenbacteria bacterium]